MSVESVINVIEPPPKNVNVMIVFVWFGVRIIWLLCVCTGSYMYCESSDYRSLNVTSVMSVESGINVMETPQKM